MKPNKLNQKRKAGVKKVPLKKVKTCNLVTAGDNEKWLSENEEDEQEVEEVSSIRGMDGRCT